jgi:hypothetical protein
MCIGAILLAHLAQSALPAAPSAPPLSLAPAVPAVPAVSAVHPVPTLEFLFGRLPLRSRIAWPCLLQQGLRAAIEA